MDNDNARNTQENHVSCFQGKDTSPHLTTHAATTPTCTTGSRQGPSRSSRSWWTTYDDAPNDGGGLAGPTTRFLLRPAAPPDPAATDTALPEAV